MGTNHLTQDDVLHVAQLARLELTPTEVSRFTAQLEQIVSHADDIAALDLSQVLPTSHPLPMKNVLREAVITDCANRDEVLGQAPKAEDRRFEVPKILGDAP
jgi:aspartyl-tRNA(Asn)/glutamyl-tRNA(Gln) amidotransferase subunit C